MILSEPVTFHRKDLEILTLICKISECSYQEHCTDTRKLFLYVCYVKDFVWV